MTWESPLDGPLFDGVFPPVGHCIYCGATGVPLSREHIVPFGLEGNLHLPKASCQKCADITGGFLELECLRFTLFNMRTAHGIRTRRPKERPSTFEMGVIRPDGREITIKVPISELPSYSWTLPYFPEPPGILLCRTLENSPPCSSAKSFSHPGDVHRLFQYARRKVGFPVKSICTPAIKLCPLTFNRMLAKIGHAFACAVLGDGAFEPCLPEFILNGTYHDGYYIGSDQDIEGDERRLWRILLEEVDAGGTPFLCARVRLFCFAETPSYRIVLGKRIGEKFSILKKRGYEMPVEFAFPGF